jgi:hypothetical protein
METETEKIPSPHYILHPAFMVERRVAVTNSIYDSHPDLKAKIDEENAAGNYFSNSYVKLERMIYDVVNAEFEKLSTVELLALAERIRKKSNTANEDVENRESTGESRKKQEADEDDQPKIDDDE